MSDYLWDKTGEPEEDVAQLENLLGALKYQPRPLELPAPATPVTAAAAARTRTATIFSRPRLALAASLLLTLLAGAWIVTRQDERPKNQLAQVKQESPVGGSEKPDKAAITNDGTNENARAGDSENARVGDGERPGPREDKSVAVVLASASKPRRRSRPTVAKRRKVETRPEENTPAPRDEIAVRGGMRWQAEQPLTPQQREATEQLMLALRLASAKLNYAQREMQEIGRAGK